MGILISKLFFADENIKLNITVCKECTHQITMYSANDKFIAYQKESYEIEIVSTSTFNILYNEKMNSDIEDIQFHPKYVNILLITYSNNSIHLYELGKTMEDKFLFKCSPTNKIMKTLFNPNFDYYLSTLFKNEIKIWSINDYYYLYNIKLFIYPDTFYKRKMKWTDCGKYLAYHKSLDKIEVFSLEKGFVEFYLNETAKDFHLIKNNEILCINNAKKTIILFNLNDHSKIFIIHLENNILYKDSIYDINTNLIFLLNEENIYIIIIFFQIMEQ